MKNLYKLIRTQSRWLCAIALVAVIGFSFAACDLDDLLGNKNNKGGPDGGGPVTYVSQDNKGNTYTLEIDESGGRSARAAQAGDTFKLTVDYTTAFGGGSLNMKFEYSGTVGDAQVSGATVSLTLDINGETITITIVGTNMTVITGKIVDDDGKEIIDDPGNLTPIDPIDPNGVSVTGVSLNRTTLDLTVGAQQTLTATVSPSNAANKNVSWSTSNPSVASVLYGLVKGESAGTATITVTTADGNKQASCTVTVTGGDIGGNTFTTIPEFRTWLTNQPVNTKETAYNVNINVSNLGGTAGTSGSLGNVLRATANANKYVNINLSGSNITTIPGESFRACTTLAGVTIGGTITSIGGSAFIGCTSLISVTIQNSVTSIGSEAFSGCTSLTGVNMGSGVTSIGASAFYGCTLLSSIAIGSGVTSIGAEAFRVCTSLTSVTIPNSVTSIGNYAFSGCTLLDNVVIPNSVTSIGDYAFRSCTNLTSLTIGNSVASIGNYAFSSCTNLAGITIPNSVTGIGDYAFNGCTNLAAIIIPNSVTGIGSRAFYDCTNLASATIGSGVVNIGTSAFLTCTNLTSVTFLGTIRNNNTNWSTYTNTAPFPGDLRAKYFATNGGPGRYTRAGTIWTKQSS